MAVIISSLMDAVLELSVLDLPAKFRFGVVVRGLGRRTMLLQVTTPPTTPIAEYSLASFPQNITDNLAADLGKTSNVWAVALSEDGQYLAGVSQNGHIKVWDLNANGEQIRDYETKGSFGICLDMVSLLVLYPDALKSARLMRYSRPMVVSSPADTRMVASIFSAQKLAGCRFLYQVC